MLANHCRCEKDFSVGGWVLLDASNLKIPGVYNFR